ANLAKTPGSVHEGAGSGDALRLNHDGLLGERRVVPALLAGRERGEHAPQPQVVDVADDGEDELRNEVQRRDRVDHREDQHGPGGACELVLAAVHGLDETPPAHWDLPCWPAGAASRVTPATSPRAA